MNGKKEFCLKILLPINRENSSDQLATIHSNGLELYARCHLLCDLVMITATADHAVSICFA